jgi:hypothetical protein
MTEREKELTDKLLILACNTFKDLDPKFYEANKSRIEIILAPCIRAAFWVGMQHSKQQVE